MTNQSIYCYPGTDILKNKFDIRDQDKLTKLENLTSVKRTAELEVKPILEDFSLVHFKKIHHYIFHDVYPFVGEVRTVNITRDGFPFANMRFIQNEFLMLHAQLKSENYLVGVDRKTFSERSAHYMAEINMLHPFPEGNGRSQRELIRLLACNAGYTLDWFRNASEDVFRASVQSKINITPLSNIIEKSIENSIPEPKLTHSIFLH